MIFIAPEPDTEYRVSADRVVRSDHRQIIYDALPEDMEALTQQKCAAAGPDIVVNHFPAPVSVHCYACGEFIEKPGDKETWYWLAGGHIFDFLHGHYAHTRYSYVEGWPQYPKKVGEFSEPIIDLSIEEKVPLSVMAAGMDLSAGTFVNRRDADRKPIENLDSAPDGFISPGEMVTFEGEFVGFEE